MSSLVGGVKSVVALSRRRSAARTRSLPLPLPSRASRARRSRARSQRPRCHCQCRRTTSGELCARCASGPVAPVPLPSAEAYSSAQWPIAVRRGSGCRPGRRSVAAFGRLATAAAAVAAVASCASNKMAAKCRLRIFLDCCCSSRRFQWLPALAAALFGLELVSDYCSLI